MVVPFFYLRDAVCQQLYQSTILVLDVTNLYLDIGKHSMVFSFPDATMTMVFQNYESSTCVFYHSFGYFVIFIEPVLATFCIETDCFFTGIHLSSCHTGPVFYHGNIIVLTVYLSCKFPLNWLLVSKSLSLPTSESLLFPMFWCNADCNFFPD